MEKDNPVLDVIISLVEGAKTRQKALKCDCNGENYTLWGCDYLLDQALRQYQIPESHYLISKAASDLWAELAKTQDIRNFHYKQKVTYEGGQPRQLDRYKGNSSVPCPEKLTLIPGKKFSYREVFHNEHVVPLKIIIKHLLLLDKLDYSSVSEILGHIYICRILKKEDRKIKQKSNRPYNVSDVLQTIYKEAGIVIENSSQTAGK
jgi:hypothetical protein